MILNVLIACEESQAETEAFRELGQNAFSCDIISCRKGGHKEWHIKQDVTPLLNGTTEFTTEDGLAHKVERWDLIIAHPPCTFLCKVGSPWMKKEPLKKVNHRGTEIFVNEERWKNMMKAREFFFKCLNAKAKYVAVENPLPMRVAEMPQPTCYADPNWFGVKYTKKTLYWLKNLPPIMPRLIHSKPKCFVSASRGKYRSRTFPALAKAIAEQWLQYILDDFQNPFSHK